MVESPVNVRVQSGEVLKVHYERDAKGFSRVYFEGRVQVTYEGTIWEEPTAAWRLKPRPRACRLTTEAATGSERVSGLS